MMAEKPLDIADFTVGNWLTEGRMIGSVVSTLTHQYGIHWHLVSIWRKLTTRACWISSMLSSDIEGWLSQTAFIQNKGRELAYCWQMDNDFHVEIDLHPKPQYRTYHKPCSVLSLLSRKGLSSLKETPRTLLATHVSCLDGVDVTSSCVYPLLSMVDIPSESRSTEQHQNGYEMMRWYRQKLDFME